MLAMDEALRVEALKALDILDSGREAIFDSLTQLAAMTFHAPVALLTLVDSDRQWVKAAVGYEIAEIPRELAFCDQTIEQSGVLVVPDALKDPRFADHARVKGEPWIRFYAGAPLTTPDGLRLGALCVIDFEPRPALTEHEEAQLTAMADAVTAAMIMRRDIGSHVKLQRQLAVADERIQANEARLAFFTEHSADLIIRVDPDDRISWVSPSCRKYGWSQDELVGSHGTDLVHPEDVSRLAPRRWGGRLGMPEPTDRRREFRVKRKNGAWAWVEGSPTVIRDLDGRPVEVLTVLRDITDRKEAEAVAGEIQSGMLLSRKELARVSGAVEVDAVLLPARTVGGDLYDAFMLDDRRLCFMLGDVTGKGVPGALFMALSKALAHSLLIRASDLATAMRRINEELSRNNGESMALALLAGVLDVEDGTLQLCNAGHENPMIVGAPGEVAPLDLLGGPPLCAEDGYPYQVEARVLEPGQSLVCVTDGVTEAQNTGGDLFGRAGLFRALVAWEPDRPLRGLVDDVVASVRSFEAGGEPSDDLAILALRRPGYAAPPKRARKRR
jgi:PAS domain S-box-containing protein